MGNKVEHGSRVGKTCQSSQLCSSRENNQRNAESVTFCAVFLSSGIVLNGTVLAASTPSALSAN